eukprot:16290-Heterococcus_DN1.PRE.2
MEASCIMLRTTAAASEQLKACCETAGRCRLQVLACLLTRYWVALLDSTTASTHTACAKNKATQCSSIKLQLTPLCTA